jgi:hypothetical protein
VFKILFKDDFYFSCGTTTNTFYLDINGHPFPDKQWTDFSVIVLNWWISAVIKCYQSYAADFKLLFMDGPYYIECAKRGLNIHMDCIEDRKNIVSIVKCDVSIDSIIYELIEASSEIIKAVENQDFKEMHDLKDLKRSLKILRSL